MKYVVQHNSVHIDHVEAVRAAITKHNLPCVYVGVIPFSHEIISEVPLDGIDFIPYGSTTLTTQAYQRKWKGQYFNPETFRSDTWLDNRDDMLNTWDPMIVTDAIKFLRKQDQKSLWFIRPTEDLKAFSGQVIEAQECADWLVMALDTASSGNKQLLPDTHVSIAEPQNIQAEWRWFVVGGKVISGSIYRMRGQLTKVRENDADVVSEAQRYADKWLPSPCCVMDLALVNDKIKVIEFNTLNSSGFYDHDVDEIIKSLYDYTVKISQSENQSWNK